MLIFPIKTVKLIIVKTMNNYFKMRILDKGLALKYTNRTYSIIKKVFIIFEC